MTTTNVSTTNLSMLQGNVQYRCDDGVWNQQNASCTRITCLGTGVVWSANSNTCSSNSSTMKYGDSQILNQPSGFSGNDATYQCMAGGSLSQTNSGSAQCLRDCASNNYNWTNNGTCNAITNVLVSGQNQGLTDNSGNTLGSATANCNNGTITLSGTSCNTVTPAGYVSWGNGCGGSYGNLMITGSPYSSSTTVTNSNGGYTGSITVIATSGGGYTTSGAVCYQNCSSTGSTGWSAGGVNCSGSGLPSSTQGQSYARSSNNGNIGNATFTCNNGSWNPSGQSCVLPLPPAQCGSANGQTYESTPNNGLCSVGSNSGVSLSGTTYNWTCTSGSDVKNCSARFEETKCKYDANNYIEYSLDDYSGGDYGTGQNQYYYMKEVWVYNGVTIYYDYINEPRGGTPERQYFGSTNGYHGGNFVQYDQGGGGSNSPSTLYYVSYICKN